MKSLEPMGISILLCHDLLGLAFATAISFFLRGVHLFSLYRPDQTILELEAGVTPSDTSVGDYSQSDMVR